MSSRMVAVRAGLQRGWIEFRQSTTNGQDLWSVMFFPIISLVVMFLLRHNTVPGTGFSLGSQSIPGILGMNVVLNGMVALALSLTMDREDGTLLRAKATPNGMIGYLTGKVLSRTGTAVVLMGVSGVFYPISAFPEWLQWLAQVFPLYWLGLGLRSAMLPETLAATEVGESWRHLETIGVLGLWAIAGLLLAPVVLRRMARRESGSAVAVRRQKAMQRTM
jgi:ABC-2 type transport system permease protein